MKLHASLTLEGNFEKYTYREGKKFFLDSELLFLTCFFLGKDTFLYIYLSMVSYITPRGDIQMPFIPSIM